MMKTFFLLFLALSNPLQAQITNCSEEGKSFYEGFVFVDFDKGRTTAGLNDVLPVKKKIQEALAANPKKVVTEIALASLTPKIPLLIKSAGVFNPHPESDVKTLGYATERIFYLKEVMKGFKEKVTYAARIAGPEYVKSNDKFVTAMSPGYEELKKAIYSNVHEKIEGGAASYYSLQAYMEDPIFDNLHRAKYFPYHGIRISILGYEKCTEAEKKQKITAPNGSAI